MEDKMEMMESNVRDLIVMLRRMESREEEYKRIIHLHAECLRPMVTQRRPRRLQNCGPGYMRMEVQREESAGGGEEFEKIELR